MKKDTQMKIRDDVWKYTWDKYKNEYTMEELAKEVFDIPLATFFRSIKRSDYKPNKK